MIDLAMLRKRMSAASGPNRDLDWDIQQELFGIDATTFHGTPRYTASVDLALALAEAKLPGWRLELVHARRGWRCEFLHEDAPGSMPENHPTAPLAILSAMIDALLKTGADLTQTAAEAPNE